MDCPKCPHTFWPAMLDINKTNKLPLARNALLLSLQAFKSRRFIKSICTFGNSLQNQTMQKMQDGECWAVEFECQMRDLKAQTRLQLPTAAHLQIMCVKIFQQLLFVLPDPSLLMEIRAYRAFCGYSSKRQNSIWGTKLWNCRANQYKKEMLRIWTIYGQPRDGLCIWM